MFQAVRSRPLASNFPFIVLNRSGLSSPPITGQAGSAAGRSSIPRRQSIRHISGGPGKSSCANALSSLVMQREPTPPPPLPNNAVLAGPAPPTPSHFEPSTIIMQELKSLSKNMQNLLGSGHPILDSVAKYYVQGDGKHLRPMIVLLMSQATAVAPKDEGWQKIRLGPNTASGYMSKDVNASLSPLAMLQDFNPGLINLTREATLDLDELPVLTTQKRLAEIVEMVHTASLFHDDVIDNADSRRGRLSGNLVFGNKMAVLAGDFLLGRASVCVSRLRDPEVSELMSTAITNLVEGEFMQLKNTCTDYHSPDFSRQTMDYYLQKTYLKTASLISKSCRGAALLGGATREVADAAYEYGKNLGLSFQIVDDLLDFTVTEAELGKPVGADLKLGLATAPVLFAFGKYPELGPMIERQFNEPGDVERVRFHFLCFSFYTAPITKDPPHYLGYSIHRPNSWNL